MRHLRLATVNLQSLGNRLQSLLVLLATNSIDIACIQEARVSARSFPSIQGACKSKGYTAYLSEPHLDDEGRVTGGCLTLSKWPMYQLLPPDHDLNYRVLLTAVALPGQEQFILANWHGQSGNQQATDDLGMAILDRAKALGRPLALIGDFNLVPTQGFTARATTAGWLRRGDPWGGNLGSLTGVPDGRDHRARLTPCGSTSP